MVEFVSTDLEWLQHPQPSCCLTSDLCMQTDASGSWGYAVVLAPLLVTVAIATRITEY